MKLSYKWLSEYVNLTGVTPVELADKMTNAGLEVEGVEPLANATNLVIGEIIECVDHPESDHLHITKTSVGDAVYQIVCGAPNVRTGLKVIVALPGAELPDGKIEKSIIKGQESNGMLCALYELGVDKKVLSEAQVSGIEELPADAPIGETKVLEYLGLDDFILDVSLTPNRADCQNMWAMAKEVGAILRRPVILPDYEGHADGGLPTQLRVATETEKCPAYLGKIVNKLKVGPSPAWMVQKLHAYGMNSINNIVDISNIVMIETGQPMHFYNLEKLPAKEITVVDGRTQTLRALDGKEFEIEPSDVLITTGGVATGIGGIMGGEESMIDENTTSIMIEAAQFNYAQIRRTMNRLNLVTEAASRFAKGVEPLAVFKAMDRSIQLLKEYAEADEIEETVLAGTVEYEPKVIKETLTHCNTLLGTDFSMDQVVEVLAALDFKPEVSGDEITCYIPSYRIDMEGKADIDEEVIRLIGFDSLPTTLPNTKPTLGALTSLQKFRRTTHETFVGNGFNEILTYTLINEAYAKDTPLPCGEAIKLPYPMSEARSYIRTGLMNSMLETVAYNQDHGTADTAFYEISTVYGQGGIEDERLALAINGKYRNDPLHKDVKNTDFYTLKGLIYAWLNRCGYDSSRISVKENVTDTTHYHPYASAELYLDETFIGLFGKVHPEYAKKFELKNTYYAELLIRVIHEIGVSKMVFETVNRYPSVTRDIALVVRSEVTALSLLACVRSTESAILKSEEIFDVYEGEHVEAGKKSVAMRIVYQAEDRTLTDEEVAAQHQIILDKLKNELDAELRG